MSNPNGPLQPVAGRSRATDAANIYAALVLFGLTAGAVYLLIRLELLLIILFLSLLVASGLASPMRRLEGLGIPRAPAILLIYLVVGGLLGAVVWYVLLPVLGQASVIAQDLPQHLNDVEQVRRRVADLGRDYPILPDLEARLVAIAGRTGSALTAWLLGLPEAVAKALFTLISIFTISFLLLLTKERLLVLILSLTHPRHRAITQRVLAEMGERLGAYLRAKLIVIAIVGTLVWATLVVLGSPYAVLVAIFAGLTEALPRIGPWFGRVAILLAVLPLGWRAVGIAMVAHVVIENLKGQFISPLVESNQVEIHPLTAFIAIIAGGILLGWLGALIAVPLAAVVQVLVEDVVIPWRHARLLAAEDAYAVGPAPPESEPGWEPPTSSAERAAPATARGGGDASPTRRETVLP